MSLPPKRDRPRTTGRRGDWDVTSEAPPKKPKAKPKPRSKLMSTKGPERSEALARGEGPKRKEALAPGKPPERNTGVANESAKRKARRPEREAVRKKACALAHLGGCSGPIDTHEIVRTSQMAEARYMDDVTIGLCREHHRTLDLYRLTGERYGVRVPRWVYDADPVRSVDEAARLRSLGGSGTPYWWGEEELVNYRDMS